RIRRFAPARQNDAQDHEDTCLEKRFHKPFSSDFLLFFVYFASFVVQNNPRFDQPVPGSNLLGSGISGVMTRQLSPVSRNALKSFGVYENSNSGVRTTLPPSLFECMAASSTPLTKSVRSTGYGAWRVLKKLAIAP